MNINSKIIFPNIYVLSFDTQYDLCMSFVRMQEFYESASSKFRGKYFQLEDYIDYWSQEFGNGSFDYPSKWTGFNLSGTMIDRWTDVFDNKHMNLRIREEEVLNAISTLRDLEKRSNKLFNEKYYVIGVYGKIENATDVIEHELAHALYYLDSSYRRSVCKLIKGLNKKIYTKAEKFLLKMGYCKGVIKDEIQAYFSTSSIIGITLGQRKEFVENFNEYRQKIN